jgi:hypothetical protein
MSDSTTVATDRRDRRRPWRPGRGRLQAVGQLGWGLGDQALSSLTNFALNLLVARQVGVDQLGVFSLVFATYLLALGVSRSLNSDALAVRYSAAGGPAWREAAAQAGGGALGLGLAGGLACVLAGWVAGGLLGQALVVLGLFLPGLLLQDVWRFAFVARGRSAQAFVNDLVWALALAAALAVLLASGRTSVVAFEVAWAGSAGVAALAGIAQARLLPWPLNPLAWWRRHRDLNARYLGEFLTIGAVSQLNNYGVSAVAGLAVVGALRAGEILIGPVYVLFMGGNMIAVAEGARVAARSAAALGRLSLLVSAGMSAAAALWGVVLILLPDSLGTRVLGPTWYTAAQLVVPFALLTVGLTASAGPQTGLRALAAARRGLRARLLAAPLMLAGAIGGAALAGAVGAAWGMAAGYWAAAVVWWWQFRLAVREAEAVTA